MFKSLALRFFESFSKPTQMRDVELAPITEEAKVRISLTGRGTVNELIVKDKEWIKAENIAKRKSKLEAEAAAALEKGKAMAELAKKQIEESKEHSGVPDVGNKGGTVNSDHARSIRASGANA